MRYVLDKGGLSASISPALAKRQDQFELKFTFFVMSVKLNIRPAIIIPCFILELLYDHHNHLSELIGHDWHDESQYMNQQWIYGQKRVSM